MHGSRGRTFLWPLPCITKPSEIIQIPRTMHPWMDHYDQNTYLSSLRSLVDIFSVGTAESATAAVAMSDNSRSLAIIRSLTLYFLIIHYFITLRMFNSLLGKDQHLIFQLKLPFRIKNITFCVSPLKFI